MTISTKPLQIFIVNQHCFQREPIEFFVKQYNKGTGELQLNLEKFVDLCVASESSRFELVHFRADQNENLDLADNHDFVLTSEASEILSTFHPANNLLTIKKAREGRWRFRVNYIVDGEVRKKLNFYITILDERTQPKTCKYDAAADAAPRGLKTLCYPGINEGGFTHIASMKHLRKTHFPQCNVDDACVPCTISVIRDTQFMPMQLKTNDIQAYASEYSFDDFGLKAKDTVLDKLASASEGSGLKITMAPVYDFVDTGPDVGLRVKKHIF